jgi:hypothetical protein
VASITGLPCICGGDRKGHSVDILLLGFFMSLVDSTADTVLESNNDSSITRSGIHGAAHCCSARSTIYRLRYSKAFLRLNSSLVH